MRKALELGAVMGARSRAIDDRVASLTPGKRADLIMVSTRPVLALNAAHCTKAIFSQLDCTSGRLRAGEPVACRQCRQIGATGR